MPAGMVSRNTSSMARMACAVEYPGATEALICEQRNMLYRIVNSGPKDSVAVMNELTGTDSFLLFEI
jgi:hypothetical protein